MYKKLRYLKDKTDAISVKEAIEVENEIANHTEENYNKLKTQLETMESKAGGLNHNELWKLKKKLCPDSRDPPSAMLDDHDNLLTTNKAIQERAVEVFSNRLKANPIEEHLKQFEDETNRLCEERLKECRLQKTDPWDEDDLNQALKQLDDDKSRDPEGFSNELFKNAGTDLLKAVLKLINLMKERQMFPKVLEKCNITTIHKKKSKNDFSNYRGVFRVTILRSILDRLIYNSSYEVIDSNLTDGNVGARKRRGCRDNMFVLSAINNSILNGNSDPIQLQVTDIKTCFDKMWLQTSTNALYECGLRNDMLSLMFLENMNAQIAIKVNNKLTRRIDVQNVEMQGTVMSSLKCTSSMDRLNKTGMSDH